MQNDYSKDSKFGFVLGSLRPTVAQLTGRYDVAKKVQRVSTVIEPGMFLSTRDASPTYLPAHWSPFIHPEGKLYFHRNSGLSVVTDAYLYTSEIGEQICAWTSVVEKLAQDKGFLLPIESVELFLQLDGEDCNYYFIDRSTQTLFWLDRHDTTELGLHPTISPSHLRLALEIQYWAHVENFCMHVGGVHPRCLEDLILVFSHALADTLTSKLSTFPYEAKDCEKFLGLLTASRDRIRDGYTVSYVARLWGVVAYNRYETHFGQEQSRLSRDTSILVEQETESNWARSIVSLITFRASERYSKRLNELFNDKFVYGSDWDSFMASCIKGWQNVAFGSVGLLLLHIFCFFLPVYPLLAYLSSSLVALAFVSSAFLVHRHESLDKAGASPAHDYLSTVCSPRFKFQGVALVYALPRTFFLSGSLFAFFQALFILCQHFCIISAASCVGVILSLLLAIHYATSDIQLPSPRKWTKYFTRTKDEALMV
ncbi:hypothetical protein CVT25_013354 [Psilocybe cyanescens]|uniref:WW domain-containing protein n=1 Tax=Psilocybe cyanescens TaxID=93625 RepID=A0A409WT75_PSICY|nr:hypothetical protein CVT25_013354 [Psilocybe cyanescens]